MTDKEKIRYARKMYMQDYRKKQRESGSEGIIRERERQERYWLSLYDKKYKAQQLKQRS